MATRVLSGYQGRPTNEQWIGPGVYENDDPRLFGRAMYLVENGHAVEVDAEPAAAPIVADYGTLTDYSTVTVVDPVMTEYSKMKKVDLVIMARDRGYTVKQATKAQLADLLRQDDQDSE